MYAEYEAWYEFPNNNDHITEAFRTSTVNDDWDEEREAKNEYEYSNLA